MSCFKNQVNGPVTLTNHGAIGVIGINNPPVNALSVAVRQGLVDCIEKAVADDSIAAIVVTCDGRTFIAGADISEFGKTPLEPHLPDVLQKLDQCSKPVVAALFGTVLGGGFEVALSCHYRVAQANTKLGLPEVTLGVIPGAGGTQLLPRIGGVELALEMISSGKPKLAKELAETAVIDLLVADELTQRAIGFANELLIQGKTARPTSQLTIGHSDLYESLFAQWRAKLAKKARGQLAPQYAIDSIENALRLPFSSGMVKEREMFINCRNSAQSRAMRHAFFAERSAAKLPVSVDDDVAALDINVVAIIGAGTMGGGIAMCFVKAGIEVKLLEMSEENLLRGISAIKTRFEQALKRGLMSEEQLARCMALIQGTCDYQDLANVDLVVEAAFETMAVKQQIFSTLDKICKPEAILASNTSYLDINEIANATRRPHKVMGMHFFSPANIMKLLEVVRADATDDQSVKTAMALGKKIGKISVAVSVCYGFVGNRMYACYGREANMLLLEGATPSQIDNALQQWGMAMGPLAVNDMSGIDIAYKARRENSNLPDDPAYFKAADLMVEAERLGQKTAAGFYQYDKDNGARMADNSVLTIFANEAQTLGVTQRDNISDEEIQQRLIFALINEGAHILEEGIASRASDIDVIWLNGYGFPRYLGGPMRYADELGLDKVVATIKQFEQQFGSRYWSPAPLLIRLLENGQRLAEQ